MKRNLESSILTQATCPVKRPTSAKMNPNSGRTLTGYKAVKKNKTKGVDGEIRRDSDFTTMWVEGVPGREHSVLDQVGHRQVEMKRRRGRVRQLLGIELEDTNQTFWGKCCRYLTAQLSKRPGHQLRAEARFPWS